MQSGPSSSSSSSAAGKPDRLYVGNLAPSVDEYALLQVFQKYGKITKLDFMFHKSGVLKGKPRGYAFIEFSNKDDALKAMVKLHDRLLRGRNLVVTYANSAPPTDLPPPIKGRRSTEPAKTTTLSLLKTSRRPQSAAAQIAAMEAKLAAMAKRKPADEDYIPGQSVLVSRSVSPMMAGSVSPMPAGSQSPLPPGGGDVEIENVLGEEEGERAAEDLAKEMEDEMRRAVKVEDEDSIPLLTPKPTSTMSPEGGSSPPSSLPAKPVFDPAKVESTDGRPVVVESRVKAVQAEIKRGLAGLPKRPDF
ncbi:hypothetical protein BCR39DRAFT_520229 [Naematelia encephala]|uniref:Probable RNA-binding protein 18 n=1 Tax=Naematelia encephala TaxID=71784 RepID=A0A1Y2BF51_9TREE|nr:hypothetical protein BCR39DRAFT_520229 [Naematelia encephala]